MHMNDADIRQVLNTVKTIALVGASDKTHRASYQVMEYLLAQGYHVIPVSPKLAGKTVLGQHVYATLADVPVAIDMVDVFRNSDALYAVTEEAIGAHAKVLWTQLNVVDNAAAQLAKEAGLQVVMDKCPAIEIPRLGLEKRQ